MESTFVLMVFCGVLTQMMADPLPGPGQTLYDGKNDDQPSSTAKKYEIDSEYYSGMCYKYDALLNEMLPGDYLEDPVKHLKQVYLTINLDSHPNEKYYLTVLKTYDAYQRGLIRSLNPKRVKIHAEGIRSELYLTAPGYFENRLISHADISRARTYFSKKRDRACESATENQVQESTVNHGNTMKCFKNEQIRDFTHQMKKIDLNLEPGVLYYKLVLKINRALHCKQLTVIEGTLITGALGIKTEEYFAEDDHTRLILPSIKDRRQARAFFKEWKQTHQPTYITEPSYSSSDEGQGNNNRKVAAAAAGAVLMANKAGESSSDESDNKHGLGGSKLISEPVLASQEPLIDRQPDVPLYPIKDQVGSPTQVVPATSPTQVVPATSPTTIVNIPTPLMVASPPPQGSVSQPPMVNTGNPVLLRKQSSLVREEDVDLRVKVEAEITIRRKTVL